MKLKLLNILEKIKDLFELGKWIIMIITLITSLGWIGSCVNGNKKDKESETLTEILTSEVKQITTESGKNATKAQNWELKYKSLSKYTNGLKNNHKHDLSRFNAELLEANKTINDLEIKHRNLQNYIKNDLVSKDSIRTELIFIDKDKIEIKPIKKKHIKIDFIQDGKYLDVKYEYKASIKTVISRYPELKNNGKKHFLNWGFLYGWDYKTTSIIDDPSASIDNLVEITFDK